MSKDEVVTWVQDHYPQRDWSPSTISAQLYGSCVNVPSGYLHRRTTPKILYYNKSTRTYELYDAANHGIYDAAGYKEGEIEALAAQNTDIQEIKEELDSQISDKFAYEAHLRDYLAKNLSLLEKGLTLWGNNRDSVEYFIGGRRIDILARDAEGSPVAIELKLSKGHERVIGQALLYRGMLKKQLAVARVRIMLVAAEITDELKIASGEMSDVELFEYTLSMQVRKATEETAP